MKGKTSGGIVTFFSLLLQACANGEKSAEPSYKTVSLAIEQVTVIDPERRQTLTGQTVYIDGDQIIAVLPGDPAEPLKGHAVNYAPEQVMDGSGKFLIPGLMDMHAHVGVKKGIEKYSLGLFIANGVTGIRDPFADCWEPRREDDLCLDDLRAIAQKIEAGDVIGPRLLRLSSSLVRGVLARTEGHEPFFNPKDAAEARQLAQYLKARGVDMIKTYNYIPREAYFALTDEAGKLGLEVSGHVPAAVDVVEASNAGHRTIEHARAILYDCSDFGPQFRQRNTALAAATTRAALDAVKAKLPKQESDLRLRRTVEGFDAAHCNEVLAVLKQNNTYYVPTHLTREMDYRAADPDYRGDSRRQYIAPYLQRKWEEDLTRSAQTAVQAGELLENFFTHGLKITRLAHAAGVKVMIGTDANDTMVFPGFSVHDEMAHFAAAGLAPMDILRAATTVPAAYLKQSSRYGGIAPGKAADLVLLDKNPLIDIRHSTAIAAVIFGGHMYSRANLDALLAEHKAMVAANRF